LQPTIEPTTEAATPEHESIIVGSKEFTEQLLLGKMLVFALQDAGYKVVDQTGFGGTRLVREALEEGEIDLYWELSGAALTLIHGFPAAALPTDPNRAYQLAKSQDEELGLIWLERLEINNTYTLVVSEQRWNEGITTLEQLADFMNANDAPWRICVESEFVGRPDGLHGLQEHYGFSFKDEKVEILAMSQIYEYLQAGECEVAEVLSTDGRIAAWDLYRLADTRRFFPFYNPAPVIRQATLQQHPDLGEFLAGLLSTIVSRLDETTMSQLNACVDIGSDGLPETGDEMTVEEVASAFLHEEPLACLLRPIVIGSTTSAEQLLLSKIFILWLKELGYDVVDQTALGDTLAVREALKSNEIDVQWEIINNALTLFHNIAPEALPLEPNRALTLVKSLDQELGIVWLERVRNVNATFTLIVEAETYQEGITTLPELADFMNDNDSTFKLCAQEAFYHQLDGLAGMEEYYGFKFKADNILLLDSRGIYDGLRDGRCDVAQGLTTGSHEAYGFQLLEDSERFFLPFVSVPIIRVDLLTQQPELAALLNTIGLYLDGDTLEILNSRIQIGADGIPSSGDEESAETAALGFLCALGLLEDCPELAIGGSEED
jgi:osmoprotectant transport system substrate-binding protein